MMFGHDLVPLITDLTLSTLSESAKPHNDNDNDNDTDDDDGDA